MCNNCKGQICKNKILHILTEFVIAAVVGVIASFIHFPSMWYAFWIAFMIAFAVGVFKESMNVHKTGCHFCLLDLVLDLIGCLLGACVTFLSNYLTWYPIIV